MYARIGKPHCPNCEIPIAGQTAQQIVEQILSLPEGTKLSLLAPIVRGRKGEYKRELLELKKDGFVRARIDGDDYELGEDEVTLDKQKKHDIDVYVDRLVIKAGLQKRVTDSVETALKRGQGFVRLLFAQGGEEKLLSEKFACLQCGFSFPDIEPRMFSFNNPAGACPTCTGLGERMFFDVALVIPDPTKTLADGAILPWSKGFSAYYMGLVEGVAKHYKQKMNVPWQKLPESFRKKLLHGTGEEEIAFQFQGDDSTYKFKKPFEGVMNTLERRYKESESDNIREEAEKYMSRTPCEACKGARLKPESLSVLVDKKPVSELCALSIGDALQWFSKVALDGRDKAIAQKILKEIVDRLGFLVSVGLDYLSLDRASATLSGGEGQRIRLATQIGSALMGVLYVLDEPSIGLHQRDNQKLIRMLERLRDLGNTVLVVEHDEDTILAADHVIDMGPGAGKTGGEVVSAGTPAHIQADGKSVTGQYLRGVRRIDVPAERRRGNGKAIAIEGARGNNLKNVSAEIPLGTLTCVTGVSGSGKSTLILDTLYRALAAKLELMAQKPEPHGAIKGLEHIDSVIDIDQSPIGRTPRSNPATYTGLFAHIRDLFAELPEAKARGFGPGRFSFNVKGGRCESCEGDGILRIDMQFLPDMFVTCEVCAGKRYNAGTLEVLYRGKSIADVLDMTVAEAREFLSAVPYIKKKLDVLFDVGLTYIHLGQAATTLSGGEAQRIKLARELAKRSTGRTLYILDEPTTGLHFADVQKLLDVLQLLVDAGNTVLVIEHNLDVVKCADWLIDLGPEGGAKGGIIIGVGTPEQLAKNSKSHTGAFLAELFARDAKRKKAS